MTVYIIGHKQRSGTIELNLTSDQEYGVKIKSPSVLMGILSIYKKRKGYEKFIPWHGLTFKKKDSVVSNSTTNLGACDKDWCNHCRKGDYTKCPNR